MHRIMVYVIKSQETVLNNTMDGQDGLMEGNWNFVAQKTVMAVDIEQSYISFHRVFSSSTFIICLFYFLHKFFHKFYVLNANA